ncbi:MAG: trypsin-like peptidase domain-containing protein, partial [Pirellulales bacterium]
QVAVVADATVSICHLADGRQAQVLKCKSNGHAAWSGDGAYLCIGRSDAQGVHIFRNPLTATEVERGKNWWSKIIQLPARDDDHAVVSGPLAQFQNFDIKSERDDVVRSFTRALEVVPGRAPADWRSVGRYQRDAQARDKLEKARKNLQEPGGIGVGIFQLEQAHKAHPQNVPLAFYLAEALHQSGQHDRAEKLFKKVVREDSGQSDLALNALVALHELRKEAGDAMGSLYCLSAALEIDRANPTLSPQAIPLLKAYGLQELAQRLAGQTPHQQATPSESIRLGKLPALPHSREEVRVLQTSEIYAATVPATVLIRTPDGSGTGFCVAKPGYILTNAHVVGQEKTVQVYPFDFVDQKPTRLEPISGRVVFRSGDEDLAVVFIQEVPKSMRPLIVASLNAQAGTSVYAIGNPGLDDEILEQTVSQGIVSHAQRQWRGNLYLQHTAGVNPGNSGGPLLNNEGHVVGMVTLKAYLQSVSFAIPVSQIRRAFAEGDHR